MVDAALPKSDRLDLPDKEEQTEITQVAERIAERAKLDPTPPPKVIDAAKVTLTAKEWRTIIQSLPAVSPLVSRVLGAIRQRLQTGDELVIVCGSVLGWNALNNALLDKGICLGLAIKITEQVARQTV